MQDYNSAAGDPNQKFLASQGISLTNYWAVAHPSEPNYVSDVAGDQFALDSDNFFQIPANISTVADLLDAKAISWGEYQEGMPYAGFQGFNYSNQQTFANKYVRKHNPLVIFDSVSSNATRLSQIKNFTGLWDDINSNKLPQWAFITPNMTNDAHDTNVTFGSTWERGFVEKLRNNTDFWNNTLLLITFDETENYPISNRVFSVLLGGAIPQELIGTTDDTFYTHYSSIATVSANWGLPSLGRWDCGANIFQIVANKTGYTNYKVDTSNLFLNSSFAGPLSTVAYSNLSSTWAAPVTSDSEKCSAGFGVLPAVKNVWGKLAPTYNYSTPFPFDTSVGKGMNVSYSRNGTTWITGFNDTTPLSRASTNSSSGSGSSSTSSSSAAALKSTGAATTMTSAPGTVALVFGAVLAFVGGL